MAKQSVKYNEAVTMRRFGFSYKKIAQLVNCSVPWCAANLSKIEIDEDLMVSAYLDFRKEATTECPVCGGYFTFNEERGYNLRNIEGDKITNSACSYRCALHLIGDVAGIVEEFGDRANKL